MTKRKLPAPGRPFTPQDPRRGKGPAKGTPGAGRPPNAFRDFLASLRDSPDFRGAIEAAARDPDSRAFGHVLRLASAYDPDGPERRVAIGEVRERLQQQVAVIRRELSPEQATALLTALDSVWR
jgi:hypothetical protein